MALILTSVSGVVKLSGGQKQRIALAYLLEESSDLDLRWGDFALDNQTEIEIQETLNKLSEDGLL